MPAPDEYRDRGRDRSRLLLRVRFSGQIGHAVHRAVSQQYLHEYLHRARRGAGPIRDRHGELRLSPSAAILQPSRDPNDFRDDHW